MGSIIQRTINGYTYVYEVTAYRNNEGQPRNTQVSIGRVDPETGQIIYKRDYIDRMKNKGVEITNPILKRYSPDDIQDSSIKEFGAYYLYQNIGKSSGLQKILQEVFPDLWEKIFITASYMVSSNEPVMYCADWTEKTDGISDIGVSSASLTRLFQDIKHGKRIEFFRRWAEYRQEIEYLALDITSVSSYSELIDDVEWGYNRDKEKLPQINLCLLVGEKTSLPVYQAVYSGSINDVDTLRTTLQTASGISLSKISVVMDKGFYSKRNTDTLMSRKSGFKFLAAVPFSNKFAKTQVELVRAEIDNPSNCINFSETELVLGVSHKREWDSSHSIYVHVYFNEISAVQAKRDLYQEVMDLADYARNDPDNPKYIKRFAKYLVITRSENGAVEDVRIRTEAVKESLSYKGWLIIISNHIQDPREAINIYRTKDVVEKGFMRLKDTLDLHRLRVHSSDSMQGKLFVSFIALTIISYIHKVMVDKALYYSMSMRGLIHTMEKLRVQYIHGDRILYPLTRQQKDILNAFGFEEPEY